jgi:hypothetical protein
MEQLAFDLIADLITMVFELVWRAINLLLKLSRVYLPAVFYYTSVVLIPTLTLRKIAVESPRNSTNVTWFAKMDRQIRARPDHSVSDPWRVCRTVVLDRRRGTGVCCCIGPCSASRTEP